MLYMSLQNIDNQDQNFDVEITEMGEKFSDPFFSFDGERLG